MKPPELTAATTLYLCATSWLPRYEGEDTVPVPGGKTTAVDTASNLLHTAMWDLRRQGVFDFEQLRPVVLETIELQGGQSFARFEFRDPGIDLPGLEGALIKAARKVGSRDDNLGSLDDERGVRRLVYKMKLASMSPWDIVTDICFREAKAAGLVGAFGLFKHKVRITDQAAVDSLRERTDELRAARQADVERAPDLHSAVTTDFSRAVATMRTYGGDDG
jgi:hypothetical protein